MIAATVAGRLAGATGCSVICVTAVCVLTAGAIVIERTVILSVVLSDKAGTCDVTAGVAGIGIVASCIS